MAEGSATATAAAVPPAPAEAPATETAAAAAPAAAATVSPSEQSAAPTSSGKGIEVEEEDEDEEDDEEAGRPKPIYGYMKKKSPGALRLRGWDNRFFVVADMKMMWWKDKQSCLVLSQAALGKRGSLESAEAGVNNKGMINLELQAAAIDLDFDTSTVFKLRPKGSWAKGATSDIRDDDKRVYIFDTKDSEHSREEWVKVLRDHLRFAEEQRSTAVTGTTSMALSECWEDDTVSDEQAEAAAKLVRKLEAAKQRRRAGW